MSFLESSCGRFFFDLQLAWIGLEIELDWIEGVNFSARVYMYV